MKELAEQYFKEGCTCSESIMKAAIDKGLCNESVLASAMAFSGGMSSGCICGAVAASQMVIGANFDKNIVKMKAADFLIDFKAKHKVTCCKVLSKGLIGPEKRENCLSLVRDCSEILDEMLAKAKV